MERFYKLNYEYFWIIFKCGLELCFMLIMLVDKTSNVLKIISIPKTKSWFYSVLDVLNLMLLYEFIFDYCNLLGIVILFWFDDIMFVMLIDLFVLSN